MPSNLENALSAISATWAAATPPDEPERTYFRTSGADLDSGVSSHRAFWFEVPTAGDTVAFAQTLAVFDHSISARVRLCAVGVSIETLPGWLASHAVQLVNRANWISSGSLGTGVRSIRAVKYEINAMADSNPDTGEAEPNGDFDILISLEIRVQETYS